MIKKENCSLGKGWILIMNRFLVCFQWAPLKKVEVINRKERAIFFLCNIGYSDHCEE